MALPYDSIEAFYLMRCLAGKMWGAFTQNATAGSPLDGNACKKL